MNDITIDSRMLIEQEIGHIYEDVAVIEDDAEKVAGMIYDTCMEHLGEVKESNRLVLIKYIYEYHMFHGQMIDEVQEQIEAYNDEPKE